MTFRALAAIVLVAVVAWSRAALPAQPPHQETVTVRIIIVTTREAAERIAGRLRSGEHFATLARTESVDPTAEIGGLIGAIDVGQLRPELRAALQGLEPGGISPIVPVPTGFAMLTIVPDADRIDADRIDAAPREGAALLPAVAAGGSVRYMANLDGQADALAATDQFPKPPRWNQSPRAICDVRTRSLAGSITALERFLQSSRVAGRAAGGAPIDRMQSFMALGQLHAYAGRMAQALTQFLKAHEIAIADVPAATLQMEEALGIAYLHKAEMDNDVYRTPGEFCLFPPRPGAPVYARRGDAEQAVAHLLKYLEQRPDELEVRWLLNVAYMTLGQYPSGVPTQYLIPPDAFRSAEDVGRFVDVAAAAGLTSFGSAGGLIVDDFENNGRLDVVTSSMNSCEAMRLFHDNGDGTFVDRSTASGLAQQLGGLNTLQTDYNNDGCLDILTLRGGWEFPQRKSLLRNSCHGTFTDVTVAAGLATPVTSTQTAVWTDIDNDGWLDLFVGNENSPAQLFRNRKDGTFVDISHAAGVDRIAFTKGVTAGDYDNDGYQDLYVSNLAGGNFLYRNNHNGTFTELAAAAGVRGPEAGRGFATWFFDYDNDGWPDLFVTSYFISVDETVRTYMGLPHNATTLHLYRNLGNGTFRDVTRAVGLDKVFMPMGANIGDIDNDGFLDIYLGTGSPSYGSLVPNVLLRNKGGTAFLDVTASSGTGELHKGHGVAFADMDNDGDEDLLEEIGGATPGDAHALRLFENPGHGSDWISLTLVGVKSNRPAIGARITVTVQNGGGQVRAIHRTVGSGGSFGASPLRQHIGLGRAARIVALDVWWPATNTRQHFPGVGANQFLEITESNTALKTLDRPRTRLGGGATIGGATTPVAQ